MNEEVLFFCVHVIWSQKLLSVQLNLWELEMPNWKAFSSHETCDQLYREVFLL